MGLGANLDGVVDAEIIKIEEELKGKYLEYLKEQIRLTLDQGHNQLILDCKGMKILNSEGLETLLWIIEEVQSAGGLVKIASLKKKPRKIFEITQFDLIFDIYDDVIAALKSL